MRAPNSRKHQNLGRTCLDVYSVQIEGFNDYNESFTSLLSKHGRQGAAASQLGARNAGAAKGTVPKDRSSSAFTGARVSGATCYAAGQKVPAENGAPASRPSCGPISRDPTTSNACQKLGFPANRGSAEAESQCRELLLRRPRVEV